MRYIGIQGTYSGVEVSYFIDKELKGTVALSGTKASSQLISLLQQFLGDNHVLLQDLDFIAVDKGPGAFTSLRVTIATLNGIGYAAKIPLIGVNGLQALYQEAYDLGIQTQQNVEGIICLLNAYSNDAYFLIKSEQFEEEGCASIDRVLALVGKHFTGKKLMFMGNGVLLHANAIAMLCEQFKLCHVAIEAVLNTSSAHYIGKLGFQIWQQQSEVSYKIIPHYLKEQAFAVRK